MITENVQVNNAKSKNVRASDPWQLRCRPGFLASKPNPVFLQSALTRKYYV